MRIIFFGTSSFAVPILKALLANFGADISAVVTKPDEKAGRKQILTPPPVKQLILEIESPKVEIFQPEKLSEIILWLKGLEPDLFIAAAYGKIIPEAILNIPRLGCLNVHPSLLPKYRGPSPIQYAILNGDEETGVTIIKMDSEIDHGPIFANCRLQIADCKFKHQDLEAKLATMGAKLLTDNLPKYLTGETKPRKQDHSQATFTKLLTKEDGHINWSKSAEEIERMIRAFDPWPGTYVKFQISNPSASSGQVFKFQMNSKFRILKILKTKVSSTHQLINPSTTPGTIFLTPDNELAVTAANDALILEQVQPEGKRAMSGKEFLAGHKNIMGSVLQ
jgi:methionyl-tRNA formyltransferase